MHKKNEIVEVSLKEGIRLINSGTGVMSKDLTEQEIDNG